MLSNGTGFIEGYKKTNGANNLNSKHYQQNDMSFCTYRPSDRPSDRQTYTSGHVGNVNEFRTPKTPADKIRSHMNL